MAQWDVHLVSGENYVLDIQNDFLSGVTTRLVVPLLPPDQTPKGYPKLTPAVVVGDVLLYAAVIQMTALPRHTLGPIVAHAESARDDVTRALDMVLAGV
ncbi:MAG: CcdB family protein [Pseudomonadota bacterium]